MCDIDRNTDYFTERLLAEKEADLIRIANINEALREVNARLVEENRKLKETMADLIDRAALFIDIDEAVVFSGRDCNSAYLRAANKIIDRVKAAPAVDAVEVVRCKDCRHWEEIKHGYGWCCAATPNHASTKDDDFCSFGERRTDGSTD